MKEQIFELATSGMRNGELMVCVINFIVCSKKVMLLLGGDRSQYLNI